MDTNAGFRRDGVGENVKQIIEKCTIYKCKNVYGFHQKEINGNNTITYYAHYTFFIYNKKNHRSRRGTIVPVYFLEKIKKTK